MAGHVAERVIHGTEGKINSHCRRTDAFKVRPALECPRLRQTEPREAKAVRPAALLAARVAWWAACSAASSQAARSRRLRIA